MPALTVAMGFVIKYQEMSKDTLVLTSGLITSPELG